MNPVVSRDLIKHENELINHRLAWFITIQGLLLAALGFAWGKADARGLVFVFCGLGLLTSISTAFTLWSGAAAIDRITVETRGVDEPIIGSLAGIEKFAYPWYSFPVLFGVAWVSILLINWSPA
jgi:hypothetical protein